MSTWAILGTGPSMTHEVADAVRDRCQVIVVSDAYRLAPWADALVSGDRAWWVAHPAAMNFSGRKFCNVDHPGLERIPFAPHFGPTSGSGARAMCVARDVFGATKILLLGFDFHGNHFFGHHPATLKRATPEHMEAHRKEIDDYWSGCQVINCTPGSLLARFPFHTLEEALAA